MTRTRETPSGRTRVETVLMLTLVLSFAGCGDDGGTGPASEVASIQVQAPRTVLEVGETVQLAATLLDQTGAVVTGQPVTWSTSAETVATVSTGGMVTAVGSGSAEIEARAGAGSGSVVLTVNSADCSLSTIQGEIGDGESRTGTLGTEDCIVFDDGPFGEGWQFTLSESGVVMLEVTTSAFQPVALITDQSFNFLGFAIATDVGGDARLLYPLDPGTYLAWAASFETGESGDFEISMTVGPQIPCDEPVGTLMVPDTVQGTLDSGTCLSDLVGFGDPWALSVTETTTVQLDLTSTDFDALVAVTDADGAVVAFDDDSGGDLNASLVVALEPGDYTVWAASFQGTELGDYTLAAQLATGGGGVIAGTTWSPFQDVGGRDRPLRRSKLPDGWGPSGSR